MARVEIWVRWPYSPDLVGSPDPHRKVFAFHDQSGLQGAALAERIWTILSGLAPHKLSPEDLEIRERYEAAVAGIWPSAGDVFIIDGRSYVCRPGGWDEH